MNDFHYAQYLCYELYGLPFEDSVFEELGLLAYHKIGNKNWRTYKYYTVIENKKVKIPCNADVIEAVVSPFEDWNYVTNTDWNGDLRSQWTEQYIESRKTNTNPLYVPGKYLKYERVGDTLYFTANYGPICIVYRGEELDDAGLPRITDKEAEAIAAYMAYISKYKEAIGTNSQPAAIAAESLKQRWNILCDQARIAEHLDQNTMDEILDARANWNRKSYGKSLKPLL